MSRRAVLFLVLAAALLWTACKGCEAANRALDAAATAVETTAAVVEAVCGAIGDPISDECAEAKGHLAEAKKWLARAVLVVEAACGSLTTEQQARVDRADLDPGAQALVAAGPKYSPRKIEREAKRITKWAEGH